MCYLKSIINTSEGFPFPQFYYISKSIDKWGSMMFPHSPQSSVPPDKLIQQLIMQALQAFVTNDYETGVYFLEQIRSNLPRYMYQLSPVYRSLCKEIVKMLQDGSLVPNKSIASAGQQAALSHPGLVGLEEQEQEVSETSFDNHPAKEVSASQLDFSEPPTEIEEQSSIPFAEPTPETIETTPPIIDQPVEDEAVFSGDNMASDFISELSSAVGEVKKKKKKKMQEKLTGSMDELEDFDF